MSDSRIEALLEALLNGTDPPQEPMSRVEAYLYALCKKGMGSDKEPMVGIQSIEQTTTSTADGGINVVTITLTDGTTETFKIKNGSKGSAGAAGKDGAAGVNGSDYILTDVDKQEIANLISASIVDGNEVAY